MVDETAVRVGLSPEQLVDVTPTACKLKTIGQRVLTGGGIAERGLRLHPAPIRPGARGVRPDPV
jgi:hypothetical protein